MQQNQANVITCKGPWATRGAVITCHERTYHKGKMETLGEVLDLLHGINTVKNQHFSFQTQLQNDGHQQIGAIPEAREELNKYLKPPTLSTISLNQQTMEGEQDASPPDWGDEGPPQGSIWRDFLLLLIWRRVNPEFRRLFTKLSKSFGPIRGRPLASWRKASIWLAYKLAEASRPASGGQGLLP